MKIIHRIPFLQKGIVISLSALMGFACVDPQPALTATPAAPAPQVQTPPSVPDAVQAAALSSAAPTAPLATPADWQKGATGLLGGSRKATAGLAFTVGQSTWPSLTLKGGVKDGATFQFNKALEIGQIDLGQIKVPDATGAFASERADWAHNAMTFTYGSNALRLWASRLSPAVLVQSPSNALRLLSGPLAGTGLDGSERIDEKDPAPAFPKHAAFLSGGNPQVATLSATNTPLSLSSNWLLVWYAGNSNFLDTKKPLTYPGMRTSNAYPGDVPILLVFQNTPNGIKHGSDGGVELSWAGPAGYVAVLPLFGRDVLRAAQTASWAPALPIDVQQRAQTWAARLCSYPLTATETYAYDDAADMATITEDISFVQVCSGGTPFAPLPPMLALAKDALNITFSSNVINVINANYATEFGPLWGIENAQKYSWKMPGLKKFADGRRELGTGAVPAGTGLEEELSDQISKTVAAGHLRPWTFMDGLPRHMGRGDLYWANPADILYPLVEVAEVLPAGNTKQSLVTYIKAERAKYPPEDVFHLKLQEGTVRSNMQIYYKDWDYIWNTGRAETHQKRVPLWSSYALSKYYDLTGETPPKAVLDKAALALDRDMREQDWATSYWFAGFQDRAIAVVNANRHFAGLVGYARLASKGGDATARALTIALLAKAAVLRVGMAKYPRYLYSAGLTDLPANPDWMVKNSAQTWKGFLFNQEWATANDDARQVALLTQFGVVLYDQSGTTNGSGLECCFTDSHLIAYRDLTPEAARLLSDHAKADAEVYLRKVKALFPHWHAAFAEGTLGHEHNLNHPVDSYQTFLANAWLGGATAPDLAFQADISWLEQGDLFFMHKLAETVRAYKGGLWAPGENLLTGQMRFQPFNTNKNVIDKDDKVTVYLDLSSTSGPITTTISANITVPSGLSYVEDSLKITPSNSGVLTDAYAPALTWQGTLPQPVTLQFEVMVTEDKPRTLDLSFTLTDKPGRTQTVGVSLPVNLSKGPRVMLPLIRK